MEVSWANAIGCRCFVRTSWSHSTCPALCNSRMLLMSFRFKSNLRDLTALLRTKVFPHSPFSPPPSPLRPRSPPSQHPSPGSSRAVSTLPLVPSTRGGDPPIRSRSRSLSISLAQEQEQDANARAAARTTKKRVMNREVSMSRVFKGKAPGVGEKGKEWGGVKTKGKEKEREREIEREKEGTCVLL